MNEQNYSKLSVRQLSILVKRGFIHFPEDGTILKIPFEIQPANILNSVISTFVDRKSKS